MYQPTTIVDVEQGSDAWHEFRLSGIGGSEIAAIMGLDQYKTGLDVQRKKLGLAPAENAGRRADLGHVLEPYVAGRYMEETGRTVTTGPCRRHPGQQRMIASCDRFIPSKVDPGNGILEIKTTNPWTFKQVKLTGLPHTWILQLQHYLEVWDFAWGSYAVLDRESGEMLTFDVERDEDLGREIVDHIGQWWDRHIIDREPVEVETPKPVKLPEVGGELVKMGSPEWADAVAALREAKEIAAQAKQLEDAAKERVVALMGEADVAEGAGLRVYYREQAGRKTFDKKALQAAHPEIDLSQYEKQGKPFRSLRTYDVGEVE